MTLAIIFGVSLFAALALSCDRRHHGEAVHLSTTLLLLWTRPRNCSPPDADPWIT